jgi:hypothetical protein
LTDGFVYQDVATLLVPKQSQQVGTSVVVLLGDFFYRLRKAAAVRIEGDVFDAQFPGQHGGIMHGLLGEVEGDRAGVGDGVGDGLGVFIASVSAIGVAEGPAERFPALSYAYTA